MAKQLSPGIITPKATDAEVERRVIVIMKLMINGAFREEILQYASEQEDWPRSDRAIDEYISRAKKKLQLRGQPEVDQARGEAISMLNKLRALAIQKNDIAAATGAQREINKLLGTYAPEKLEWKDTTDSMSDDEIEQRIAEILGEAGTRSIASDEAEAAEFETVGE